MYEPSYVYIKFHTQLLFSWRKCIDSISQSIPIETETYADKKFTYITFIYKEWYKAIKFVTYIHHWIDIYKNKAGYKAVNPNSPTVSLCGGLYYKEEQW